jgi:nicotinamide-nucleotide amidase
MQPQPLIEIITIGREILDGRVIDSNSAYLGEELHKRDLCPRFAQRVDDHADRILMAFKTAAKRSTVIIVTGGLGPTSDDITIESFSKFQNESFQLNTIALGFVEEAFRRMNRPFTDVQKKQAFFPENGIPLENIWGTAPGMFYNHDGKMWFFLPGVPKEMKGIFQHSVLEKLAPFTQKPRSWTWKTQFTSEGELQTRLKPLIEIADANNFEFTFRTRFPENHLGLLAHNLGPDQVKIFDQLKKNISTTLGPNVFSEGEIPPSIEEVLLKQLQQKDIDLVFVESCTGGSLASRMTRVPGVSSHFWGSYTCYDNSAKEALGVSNLVIKKEGAVSELCARELALSGLKTKIPHKPKPTLCLSTTGIAGPEGDTPDKPLGLCFIAAALCTQQGKVEKVATEKIQARAGLTREENILFFTQKALTLGLRLTHRDIGI